MDETQMDKILWLITGFSGQEREGGHGIRKAGRPIVAHPLRLQSLMIARACLPVYPAANSTKAPSIGPKPVPVRSEATNARPYGSNATCKPSSPSTCT